MHELADRRIIDGFGGGDQGDVSLAEVGHDDGVVEPVSGHTRQFVDDDVVDVLMVSNSSEQSLKLDSFRHFSRTPTRLDIFIDNGQAELICLVLAGDTLSGNGYAFGVIVGLDLPWR
ncbi:hypothetical protein OHB21_13015 [Nocardia puris]